MSYLSDNEAGTVIVFDVRNFNLICVLQNPVRADFQPLIADTQEMLDRLGDLQAQRAV